MSHNESYYIKIIDALLKNGADPNIKIDDGRTLLYLAVHSENVKCVKTLLDAGANPNLTNDDYCDYTPLTAACEIVNLEMIELLLSAGADPNLYNCETNLEWIIDSDYDNIPPEKVLVATKLLLDAGYNLNKTDKNGIIETSIFKVMSNDDNIEIVKLLLSHGIDPNNPKFQRNILTIPSENGAIKILKLLLDSGADPNKVDTIYGRTALMNGTGSWPRTPRNSIEIVKLLLDSGADPNIPDYDNETPLFQATVEQNLEMMMVLLDAGADPYHLWSNKNYPESKYTIIEYAKAIGLNRAVDLLESYIKEKNIMQNTEQRLATAKSLQPRLAEESVFNLIDEPDLFDKITSYLPEYTEKYAPDVQKRMLTEKKQKGSGNKRKSKLSRHKYRFY